MGSHGNVRETRTTSLACGPGYHFSRPTHSLGSVRSSHRGGQSIPPCAKEKTPSQSFDQKLLFPVLVNKICFLECLLRPLKDSHKLWELKEFTNYPKAKTTQKPREGGPGRWKTTGMNFHFHVAPRLPRDELSSQGVLWGANRRDHAHAGPQEIFTERLRGKGLLQLLQPSARLTAPT